MKKVFLFVAFMLLSGFTTLCSAQITSHSSNDANIDGTVDIADVNNVLSEIFGTTTPVKQVVSADDINTRLKSIEDRLAVIEKKLRIDPKHECVDLGLPSKTMWATCNVGADSPEEYGDYFAWGETTPQSSNDYSWSSYKWCNGSSDTMTKYCTDSRYGTVDNKTVLDPEDDVATVNWGSYWCMPTSAQLEELVNSSYTTTTWTTEKGVYGRKITSNTNGNSIFLPAAGYRSDGWLYFQGSDVVYWSSELLSSGSDNAWELYFNSNGGGAHYRGIRYSGESVRPVRCSASE